MKKVIQTVIFLAILLVSSFGVYAQGSIEGKVTTFNHGVTIQYSVSGGEMLKEEFSEDRHHVTYECEVEEGSTINVSASRLSGPEGIDEIYIKHTFLDSGRDDIVVKKNGTVTMLYTLKDDESRIIRQMETTITVMHASSGSQVTIKWKVVKKESDSGSGSGSGSGSAWYSKQTATNCRVCKRPWSHIEVKDYYGDASIRCDEDDDDGYESLEFDTHIYCKDRIKAGKDSEIVLGLADRSAFTIKLNWSSKPINKQPVTTHSTGSRTTSVTNADGSHSAFQQ